MVADPHAQVEILAMSLVGFLQPAQPPQRQPAGEQCPCPTVLGVNAGGERHLRIGVRKRLAPVAAPGGVLGEELPPRRLDVCHAGFAPQLHQPPRPCVALIQQCQMLAGPGEVTVVPGAQLAVADRLDHREGLLEQLLGALVMAAQVGGAG